MASRTLWAPWRMAYIRGPKSAGCIFCDYRAQGPEHFRARLILCVRAHAFVILNRYPFAAGHLMVVPSRHVSSIAELEPAENAALFALVRDTTSALHAALDAEGLNVGINQGAAAGAGIAEHTHVHVVPRWRGDLNFMPMIADVSVMPEALDETYTRLQPFFTPLGDTDAMPLPAPIRGVPARKKSRSRTRR